MQVDDHNPKLSGADVLLVDEICVERDQGVELPLGRCEKLVVIEVWPPLVPSRNHLVLLSERQAQPMTNVMVEKDLRAGTPEPSSSSSPNFRR